MSKNSDRKAFLERLVPKFITAPCPYGHIHHKDISMGQKVPKDIGRRYVWCDSRHKPSPSCMSQEPGGRIWAPELPEAKRMELRQALRDYDQRKRDQRQAPGSDAPATQPTQQIEIAPQLAPAFQEPQPTTRALFPFSNLSKATSVKVFVYIKDLDFEVQHDGILRDGIYSPIADIALCGMINFPTDQWEIYDRFSQEFIPMPTTGLYYVLDNEFLIIRPSTFTDQECPGLTGLCASLHTALGIRFISSQVSLKATGKRSERASSDLEDTPTAGTSISHAAGPSKRRKTSYKPFTSSDVEVIDISDSD